MSTMKIGDKASIKAQITQDVVDAIRIVTDDLI